MIIEEVIGILRNDAELQKLLDGNHIYAIPSTYMGNSIVYSWYPESSNKIVGVDKLELHIITDTLLDGMAVLDRVKDILLTLGDYPLTKNVLQVELNGGGNLYDEGTQKQHTIQYFYITYKE